MIRKFRWFFLIVILLTVGCANKISPQSYSVGSVGQVNRTISGTVISVREVDVSGTTGTGGSAGFALGAVGGSSLGGTGRDNLAGAIGGAVLGGLVGSAIEGNATKQKGIEYVVETENGNLMTIVQGLSPSFESGQRVLVLYGSPSRVIADPRQPKK
jgi:outer membrane lipoprotein SlyB